VKTATGNAVRRGGRLGWAFTLIELLTVIVIISLLVGIAIPSIMEVKRQSMRRKSLAAIAQIEGAIRAYANDFEVKATDRYYFSCPPSTGYSGKEGRHVLVWCLTGYGAESPDTKDGFGMRLTNPRLGDYGPYNGVESLPMKSEGGGPVFIDAFDNPIFYYRLTTAGTYTSGDNSGGPADIVRYATPLHTTDKPKLLRADYLLCSKGPDGTWWGELDWDPATDDITNFLGER
jgi:prepilin-type N-terminal cleavage/methylation domain-containing protein